MKNSNNHDEMRTFICYYSNPFRYIGYHNNTSALNEKVTKNENIHTKFAYFMEETSFG